MIPILGFLLAAFAVIGNDVIQTLGTFIQSNKEHPWWRMFIFIGGILLVVLLFGWYINDGDVSYGRLEEVVRPNTWTFWYLVPPILLLVITRFGIPVSTTFLILSIFSTDAGLMKMLLKSVYGYGISFVCAFLLYRFALKVFEKNEEIEPKQIRFWTFIQWCSTAFLWGQWLIQDFANVFVFLPERLSFLEMLISLLVMLLILVFILRAKGGAIQKVVSNKTNSSNIRSATFIDLIYGLVLFYFTTVNSVPMSTTWTFVGILAGRELALRYALLQGHIWEGWTLVFRDFFKVLFGIVLSVGIVLFLRYSGLISIP